MGELFAGWRFVPPRLRSGWRLLAVTALGVLVAAALLAAVPIYSSALSNMGLQFRLDRALDESRLNTVTIERLRPGDPVHVAQREAVDTIFSERVGWMGPELLVEERSPRLLLDFAGENPDRQPWNAFLFRLSGLEQNSTITEGRLPAGSDGPPEVLLLDGFQRHAALGDTITIALLPFDDCDEIAGSLDPSVAQYEVRCRPTSVVSQTVSATVVGFVRPDDPTDERWEMFTGSFEVPEEPFMPHVEAALASDPFGGVNLAVLNALRGKGSMPLLVSEQQLFGPFATLMPYLEMRHRVGLIADVRALTLADVTRGIEQTKLMREDLDQRLGLLAVLRFPVSETLSDFRNTQTFEQIPLLIILLQVVGIVVYYVAVVASMLVERQAEELSVYRSRGASTAQLVGLYLMEGVLIAAGAAMIAPWLASQAVATLGRTPTFSVLTDGRPLPVEVTPAAYLLAAAGAGLALLALLLPAFGVARRAIVDVKLEQSRPPGRSLIQRYYLDVAAVAFAGILLWQLGQRGTVFDPDAVGGWSTDPLLLLSPFVFTIAVAALVLRFYPPLLRWTVSLLLAAGGTSVALGLRRAARAPASYARLMLLLVMAISVGTFAASYGPTVDRSQGDRVRYATGTDLRGSFQESQQSEAFDRIGEVRALDGVDDAALAYRADIGTLVRGQMQLLALEPARAASMLWFREDFAEETLNTLMRQLLSDVPSGAGMLLNENATGVRLEAFTTRPRPRSTLWARFRDARGQYLNTRIAPIDFDSWQELEAPVPEFGVGPFTFVGLRVTEPRGTAAPRTGSLYIDDIRAVLADGKVELIDDFERAPTRFGWRIFAGGTSKESFELSDEESVSGVSSAKWSWPLGLASGARMLLMNDPNVPLAVVVNPPAAARLGVGPDGVGRMLLDGITVPVSVRAVVDMFPTLLPGRSFVVVNLEHLNAVAALIDADRGRHPNELWVSSSAPLDRQEALFEELRAPEAPLRLVTGSRHQGGELATVEADPTLRASGSGILTASFSAVLGLAMVGFLVTLVLGARSRVVEFAVLRAVGSSPLQILRSMILEWGVVLTIGVAIGVLLGRRVARVMLSFLDVTDAGTKVVPPFILQTDWVTLSLGVGALLAVAALGLALAWGSSVRRDTTVELRLTR